jgi:PIN domain nuclease of toxin-antitoxin system
MKAAYILDTHAFIWHLQKLPYLSPIVESILTQVDEGEAIAIIPTICMVEMIYLAEKKRIEKDLVNSALNLLGQISENYRIAPLNFAVVTKINKIPRTAVPDMPDRIIAATALALKMPLLTRDRKLSTIREIRIIW